MAQQALTETTGGQLGQTTTDMLGGFKPAVRWESETRNGYIWRIGYDADGNVVEFDPVGQAREEERGISEYQQQQLELQRQQFEEQQRQFDVGREPTEYTPYGQSPYDDPATPQVEGQWNPYIGQWEAPAGYISPYQQQQLGFQQQQLEQERQSQEALLGWYREQQAAELEAQKQQRLAQLKAQPMSWLQYAAESGEAPVIQPWMLPLAHEEYGFQVGQEIPGWAGETAKGLPQLKRPSAQYAARLAPSQRQQFVGYEQARTGQTPADVEWRLQQYAPPGGRGGLKWIR